MGARDPGKADDQHLADHAGADLAAAQDGDRQADPDDYDYEESAVLSLEDEDLVRTAFAAALAEAIGDKGLIDALSRSRQDRAQLVEVMQTDLHGREIEELHFIAMSFGFAADIGLDPMIPEGHEGRVTVALTPTGRSFI